VIVSGGLLCLALLLALAINIPFVLIQLPAYFEEVRISSGFYNSPYPMYSLAEQNYFSQLGFISHYFTSTLGMVGCLILVYGCLICLFIPTPSINIPLYFRLSLCIPPLFIYFYFALKFNFFERIFSSVEPMLCVLLAMGFYSICQMMNKIIHKKTGFAAAVSLLAVATLWKPVVLDYRFVQNHIRQPGYMPRIEFQETLKKDFQGFWIKNVHVTYGFTGAIPEKPAKAPRIYHFEDYNQYWTVPHMKILKKNGFVHMGTYCSDFYDLPAGNHTIYHAAAKNHYWVRQEEWPATVAPGYFKTNCP